MTHKTIAFKFAASTTVVIALGIVAWSNIKYYASIDPARAKQSVDARPKIAELPSPRLSRVRLLVFKSELRPPDRALVFWHYLLSLNLLSSPFAALSTRTLQSSLRNRSSFSAAL
jgi:hypothetical protein